MSEQLLLNVSCVAVGGLGLLLEGAPGVGKSTLALELIDRGATLVGDDGILLERRRERLWAHPPPRLAGKLEIRGVGLVEVATTAAPLSLLLTLGTSAERLPEPAETMVGGVKLPRLAFAAEGGALRAEWALRLHGLAMPADYT